VQKRINRVAASLRRRQSSETHFQQILVLALGVGCFHSRLSFRRRASRCNRPKIHPRFPLAIGVSLNVDLPSKPSSYDGTRFHSGH
jgi:hypothetical protein